MSGLSAIVCVMFCLCFLQATSSTTTSVKDLCKDERSCFGLPANCDVDSCRILLSIHKEGTDFIVRDTDFAKYFYVRAEVKGVLTDSSFVCFPGTTKCYIGNQEADERFKIERKVIVRMTELDEVNGDFLYSTDVIFLETGEDVKYFAKVDTIANEMDTSNGTQLASLTAGPRTKITTNVDTNPGTITLEKLFGGSDNSLPIDYAQKKSRK